APTTPRPWTSWWIARTSAAAQSRGGVMNAVRVSALALVTALIAGLAARPCAPQGAPPAGGSATPPIPSRPPAARHSPKRSAFPRAVWETRDAIHRMLIFHRGMAVARASGRFEDPFGGRITSSRLIIHGTFREKPPYDDAIKMLEKYSEREGW